MSFIYRPPTSADLQAIAESSLVQDELVDAAEQGASYATEIAPVDTGAYRSAFHVESVAGEARLVNDDPAAAVIEWGSSDTPPFHVLSQVADWIEGGL